MSLDSVDTVRAESGCLEDNNLYDIIGIGALTNKEEAYRSASYDRPAHGALFSVKGKEEREIEIKIVRST